LRILILTPFFTPNIGGAETHLADLCRYLVQGGNQVEVLTYKPLLTRLAAPILEVSHGLKVRRIDWPANGLFYKLENNQLAELLYLAPMLFLVSALSLIRPNERPEIIHAHGLTATAAAVALSRIFRIRIVSSLHTIYRLDQRRKLFSSSVAFLLARTNRILVPSESCKKDLQSVGIPSESVDVYTNWVDQTLFKPRDKEACRRSVGLPVSKHIMLFVGRLIESKGVLLLMTVAERMPEYTFVFVGDGPLRKVVEKSAETHPNIVFVGRKVGLELAQIYSCADVLWGSADDDYLGRVAIEGLSCGVPVMIPDRLTIFGIERRVSADMLGPSVIVRVRDSPMDIEAQLKKLFGDPSIISSMSRESRKVALSLFNQENAAVIERSYHAR
jgi:glycosyltransferase involved in cell wall biosynthesis